MAVVIAFLISQILPLDKAQSQYTFLEGGTSANSEADAGFLLKSPTRLNIDLSGVWNYRVTNGPEGAVRVPSAYDFTGEVSFSRNFDINPSDLDKYKFHLVMLGANYNCGVWINGDFITNHIGGYTSFIAPIPDKVLQAGKENIIKVVTNNQLDLTKTIPLRQQVWGWKNYGGILREVFLLATPKLFIANVATTSEFTGDLSTATLTVNATVDGIGPTPFDSASSHYRMYAEVFDKISGSLVATTTGVPIIHQGQDWTSGQLECSIPNPRLWSPENPDCYILRVYIVDAISFAKLDEYPLNTGIRKLDVADKKVMLNGKRLVLKGVIWQEDHARSGSSLTSAEMEKDVALIKNLGANAIRFIHHPPHPYMLDLCDRYGMVALEELPVTNVPAAFLAEENYMELATVMMREMIVRDRNHPSVFAWGLGDEFESSSSAARKYVGQLAASARKLDGRPLYYGTHLTNGDVCSDLVDLTALTLLTRDVKEFRKTLDEWKVANPARAVFIAKMGVEVQPSNRNGYSDPLSVEAQARFYLQHIEAVKAANYDGVFVWSFNDWKGDRPALTVNSGDPWLHTLGLVTVNREKRLAYDAVRSAFNEERFVALQIGSNPSSAPVIYVLVGLVLLVGTAYLYNASRRFREALNRSMVNAYNFFSDVRDQHIVTSIHSTILGLLVSSSAAIVLSSLLYRFRSSIALDNFLSYVLVSDRLKEIVVELILKPPMFLLVFTGVFFVVLLLVSMVVLIVAPIFKARIYPFHAYAITLWSTPPLLVLLPVGMILYRLMDSPLYVLPTIILCTILLAWVLIRFLKGISIILDVVPAKVYAVGILSILGVLACIYFYLDYTQSASVYMSSLFNDLMSKTQ